MEVRQAKSQVLIAGAALWLAAPACTNAPSDTGTFGDDETGTPGSSTTDDGPPLTDEGSTAADSTADTNGVEPPKYDIGSIPDAPPPLGCAGRSGGGGGDDPLYSFIWIANSGQGTVSKIDTVTLEEVGRYQTRPDSGDPSRTSVSLNGDVAVANRNGGLVKFYANPADCVDANRNGVIDTSSGPADVLAWDDEECRAWFTPFDYQSQRPVAWTPGEWNPMACRYEGEQVWTAGASDGELEGVRVVLVDGASGEVEHAVKIPEVMPQYFGLYGGAVDAAGNFWGSQLGVGSLVRVDLETFDYDVWPMAGSGYGMTVDSQGFVWTCSYEVSRFDPETEQWDVASVGGSGGCMADAEGTLWLASSPLIGIDTETMQIVASHALPEYVHGVSIDFQGYVWGVSMGSSAYRLDPITGDYETVSGLVSPYTYSDMTGFALANAGGGNPAG